MNAQHAVLSFGYWRAVSTRSAKHLPRWQFATNVISESENENLINVELSDVKKEDMKIAVANGVITIPAIVPLLVNSRAMSVT